MGKFIFTECNGIEGLYIVEPKIFRDARGLNYEAYNQEEFAEAGLDMRFVQDNRSVSVKGVLRGMHFQEKYQQGKLVSVVAGKVFDAVVDLRDTSKTYGKWFGVVLSAEKRNMLYVPEGFAHGFLVLSDTAEFLYKLSDFYHPEDEGGVMWNDSNIGIEWPIPSGMEIIVSDRDKSHPAFSDKIRLKDKSFYF